MIERCSLIKIRATITVLKLRLIRKEAYSELLNRMYLMRTFKDGTLDVLYF